MNSSGFFFSIYFGGITVANVKRKVLVPSYYKKFKCDGKICNESCCTGIWNIFIDRHTYKKYKNIKDKEIQQKLRKYMKRNRDSIGDKYYAKLKQDIATKRCIFLTENNDCEIQLKYGADYLCDTCLTYPRYVNIIDGNFEKSLTLSCPLAAELVLNDKDGIEFEIMEESNERIEVSFIENFNELKYNTKALKYFKLIRNFSSLLIKSRQYKLWERLIILGLAMEKIQQCEDNNSTDNIPSIINKFIQMITNNEFKNILEALPINPTLQMEILKEMLDERIILGAVEGTNFFQNAIETLIGLNYSDNLSKGEIGKQYYNIYNTYYLPYMIDKDYIYENYIVNYIFRTCFPYGNDKKVFNSYARLVFHYAMLKFTLIGSTGFYKESFDTKHIIKLIQTFTKNVEHSIVYEQKMQELIKLNELNTMAYLAIMIKN